MRSTDSLDTYPGPERLTELQQQHTLPASHKHHHSYIMYMMHMYMYVNATNKVLIRLQ